MQPAVQNHLCTLSADGIACKRKLCILSVTYRQTQTCDVPACKRANTVCALLSDAVHQEKDHCKPSLRLH